MDETTELVRAEKELIHDSAHRSNFRSSLCAMFNQVPRKRDAALLVQPLPGKHGSRAKHPLPISVTRSPTRGHSLSYLRRLPLIHEPFPTANQPPLLSFVSWKSQKQQYSNPDFNNLNLDLVNYANLPGWPLVTK